jgi:hypothetical protein
MALLATIHLFARKTLTLTAASLVSSLIASASVRHAQKLMRVCESVMRVRLVVVVTALVRTMRMRRTTGGLKRSVGVVPNDPESGESDVRFVEKEWEWE